MGRGVTIFYIHIIWFFDIHIIYIHHHQASSSSGSSLPGSPVARTMGLIHGLGQGLPLGRWVAWTSTGIQSVNGHWIKKQLEHGWTMLNIGNKGSIWNNNKSYICVYIYVYIYMYVYIYIYDTWKYKWQTGVLFQSRFWSNTRACNVWCHES